jgi:phenylacetate-coenzyme A ligase PaaK-like adenylate-forming protein
MPSRLAITIGKLHEFRRNARMTRAQFEEMKLIKFRSLARYAAAKAPYYSQVVSEHRIDLERCTPHDFPPLTKAALMANFDRIVTDRRITKEGIAKFLTRSRDPNDRFLDEFRVVHTSGTSGEVGYFVYSPEDWARGTAHAMRSRGNRPRARRARRFRRLRLAYYGAVGGHFAGVTLMSGATRGLARLLVKARLCEVNSPLPETVAALNHFQPDILAGYTGALTLLAEKQRAGILRIAPISIGTAGESMSATDKRILEEAFGCPATNGYGSSEHLMMGVALPGGTSMLLLDDDLVYEPCEDHTLVTNLFNYTLPLIRYRMADILRPVARPTDRSLPYLEIESLVGRSEMMPRFVNEDGTDDFLSPHTINEIFVRGVLRFQMRLVDETAFRFAVCLDATLPEAERREAVRGVEARLGEILRQKRMGNVCFTVEVVDDIPLNPQSRKFRLIVKEAAS